MSTHFLLPDRQSFVKLPRGVRPDVCTFLGRLFAKDAQSVYSTRGVLKDVEAATFSVVAESLEPDIDGHFASAYAITPHKALYVDDLHAPKFFQPGAVAALRVLAPHFATDGVGAWYDGARIAGADVASFKPLASNYAVDRKSAYFGATRMIQADPASLRVVGEITDRNLHLACDRNSLYYRERPVVALAGATPALRRQSNGFVFAVTDGTREWSMVDLEQRYRAAIAPNKRTVVFAPAPSAFSFADRQFEGMEDDLAVFLMLCTHKTIQGLEAFTRGQRGEKAVVRSIERLNSKLPVKLAEVSATTIDITSDGVAAYRQYGGVADAIGGIVAAMKR